ncbi:Alpha/Beta hydrolase protein [Podospora australis]|uniref:Alpha/Beta hydrolase protein n=1 Tax=Podospora australis TaxID=1536484 RepID=A0AAN6WX97_9PEZI|nr:Alpha/Beta hydrolase protein [Podospora australis]
MAETPAAGEVKPYKIHIPTRHLSLARQKLELTRLPREGSLPRSTHWWEPKPLVEPLIDYWLERYSFRDIEAHINKTTPQFRASIPLPPAPNTPFESAPPLRVHFLHARSSSPTAIPLLVLPPFPLTNLSLTHLLKPLTTPDDSSLQAFHVVIPSLPGMGFSDALPSNFIPPTEATAAIFNTLMTVQLGYDYYLATSTSFSSADSALGGGDVDYRLAHAVAKNHSDHCLGTNLISPILSPPTLLKAPWEWAKWSVAWFFRGGIAGYEERDFHAYFSSSSSSSSSSSPQPAAALKEPNTLAYALCDSPVGMLAYVLKALGSRRKKGLFTEEELITLTSLAWLPGPEGLLRYLAGCNQELDEPTSTGRAKPTVGITVFSSSSGTESEALPEEDENIYPPPGIRNRNRPQIYHPPAWGNVLYNVVHTTHVPQSPNNGLLLSFESPEIIFSGVRSLAAKVKATDGRIIPVADLEGVTVDSPRATSPQPTTIRAIPIPPPILPIVPPTTGGTTPKAITVSAAGLKVVEPDSVPVIGSLPAGSQADVKGKGKGKAVTSQDDKDKDLLAPPQLLRDPSSDGESPDTLVGDGSPSPLGGRAASGSRSG